MDLRQSRRASARGAISFVGKDFVGEGRVFNVSRSGCMVESPFLFQRGEYLTIRIHVPCRDWPLDIDLAAIRWSKGGKFGLEFIRSRPEVEGRIAKIVSSPGVSTSGATLLQFPGAAVKNFSERTDPSH